MNGWRIAFIVAHLIEGVILWTLLRDYHFVDQSLYNEVKDKASLDAIRVASELGRFDLASMFLAGVSILIGVAAIFGFVEVRFRSEKRAEEVARHVVDQKVTALFNEAMKTRGDGMAPQLGMTEAVEADVLSKANEIGKDLK
ncbi:hypothetical protein RJJ63_14965 [Rhizobium hidalgonense]|uniref:hypothetical protein n=1 Tax=Rhizobium hidalgonense TaxID=1538159 RepID=UPI0028719B24|nr:hypothetical protein [Rhizobium hidalgonense]MDR9820595.1 hypothetical protein [Rhizobium hidalgonense]